MKCDLQKNFFNKYLSQVYREIKYLSNIFMVKNIRDIYNEAQQYII